MAKILIIDDKINIQKVLKIIMEEEGYIVKTASDGWQGLQLSREFKPDLIISDLKMPEMDGRELFDWLKKEEINIPVIFMTAYGNIPLAVDTIKDGAVDFLTKPLNYDELKKRVKKIIFGDELYKFNPAQEESYIYQYKKLIGSSDVMKSLHKKINLIADRKSTILIQGESGTGKELIARAIHYMSKRSDKTFIAVNCAALSSDILESELFGHVKGAFTGAVADKKGKFEIANGGTLLLDEISEIALNSQAKLLRVLQEKVFERVGDNKSIKIDLRIIATTNRDLSKEVENGRFRDDLYYRLNVIKIKSPPLRDRIGDIKELSEYFLREFCKKENISKKKLSSELINVLMKYSWPGNVRELKNVIERMIIFSEEDLITIEELPEELKDKLFDSKIENNNLDKNKIIETLKRTYGNKSKAAEILEISRKTLYNKLDKFKIKETEYLS